MAATENRKTLWKLLLILYGGIMLWLLFGRSNGWVAGIPYEEQLRQNANLTPFYTIKNYLFVLRNSHSQYLRNHCFINLAGNVLLFIPAGWLFPSVWPSLRKFLVFFAACTGMILLVEVMQLFTLLGSFDVDDMILNLSGMVLGFIFFKCKRRK